MPRIFSRFSIHKKRMLTGGHVVPAFYEANGVNIINDNSRTRPYS